MVSFPYCKINLGLQVLRKRPDGYHDIRTCFYPLPLTDALEIIPSEKFTISFSGLAIPGDPAGNLCTKAFHIMRDQFGIPPVAVHLHKVIPMGAGLGGGSSDGAFTVKLLNQIFDLNLADATLESLAAQLGSDCTFFLRDSPQLGTGKGEVLTPVHPQLKGRFVVLVQPDIHVSTAEAYDGVIPGDAADFSGVLEQPVQSWRETLRNDFETSVFRKFPRIGKIKGLMYENDALYASMSGSGSAVFGIFEREVNLTHVFPGMFYWSSVL